MHNMDGFFVAKFKVEKRTKKTAEAAEKDEDGATETAPQAFAFDEEEDKAIIEGMSFLCVIVYAWLTRVRRVEVGVEAQEHEGQGSSCTCPPKSCRCRSVIYLRTYHTIQHYTRHDARLPDLRSDLPVLRDCISVKYVSWSAFSLARSSVTSFQTYDECFVSNFPFSCRRHIASRHSILKIANVSQAKS